MKFEIDIFIKHKVLFLISLIIVFILGWNFYLIKTRTYITAEFTRLRPFHKSVPVYFKGFKIGRAENVRPNYNYTATVMTIVLYPKNLQLPINTIAKFKTEDGKRKGADFIDLAYPDSPSIYFLKTGDKIKGKTAVNVETYMANQDPDTLNAMRDNLAKSAENLSTTVSALGDLFLLLNDVVKENKPNILKTTNNMAQISENLKNSTAKINSALEINKLSNTVTNADLTVNNLQETSKNLKTVSKDITKITKDITKMTPKVDCIIADTNFITKNLNDITSGVSSSMQQNFGLMRVLFGKSINAPLSKKKCPLE